MHRKMDSADGPPPLEDMTDLLQQVTSLRELKEKQSGGKNEVKQKTNGHATINKQQQKENHAQSKTDTTKDNPKLSTDDGKSKQTSKQTENAAANDTGNSGTQVKPKEGFGGMKKGFLFGGASKPKSQNKSNLDSTQNRQQSKSEVKVNKTLEDVPFITKKDEKKQESLQFSEVQEAMEKTNQKLMESKEWVTDDLLENIQKNDKLAKKLQNPMFIQAIGEFQTNPQEAMKKYGSNSEVQEFFTDFCGLMGSHFNKLADKQAPTGQAGTPASPAITTTTGQGADMSVRSSTNPNQPTSADEHKMQEIMSDPEVRDVLMDPKVQELFECLRKDPVKGQRLLQEAPRDFKQKIQKLVNAGLLQFQ